jgi:cytoskeletal protein CcmA (bactofilin family)
MARVGCSTTFTGKIVADEDIEVQGTVEGSIVLDRHQLTVGGVVQADVEANSVLVMGRVTGNVTATDVVEVKSGGYIGGDVTAPRIIMADGAFVMGALDMASVLPRKLSRLP